MSKYNLWVGRHPGFSWFRPPYIKLNRDGLCPLEIDITREQEQRITELLK